MRTVKRFKGQCAGTYTVFDSVEEAKANGITEIHEPQDKEMVVGNWFSYLDGVVAQCIRVKRTKYRKANRNVIYSPLNSFVQPGRFSSSDWQSRYSLGKYDIKLNLVDEPKIHFAEAWLLQGYSIEAAARRYLYRHFLTQRVKDFTIRMFAYMVISGPWFDELLSKNRLLRERWMSLVGAFNAEGVTDAYVAQKVKEALDSKDAKERMNALNKAIDVISAEQNKPKGRAVFIMPPTGAEEKFLINTQPKQLISTEDTEQILKEITDGIFTQRSESNPSERKVLEAPQGKNGSSHAPIGDTSVPVGETVR